MGSWRVVFITINAGRTFDLQAVPHNKVLLLLQPPTTPALPRPPPHPLVLRLGLLPPRINCHRTAPTRGCVRLASPRLIRFFSEHQFIHKTYNKIDLILLVLVAAMVIM